MVMLDHGAQERVLQVRPMGSAPKALWSRASGYFRVSLKNEIQCGTAMNLSFPWPVW